MLLRRKRKQNDEFSHSIFEKTNKHFQRMFETFSNHTFTKKKKKTFIDQLKENSTDDLSFDLTQFSQSKLIGKGGFGAVYQVIDKRTGHIYAAKISIQEVDFESQKSVRELKREVNILAMVRYASILFFVGYSPIDFAGNPNPVIVTEYLPNGSLEFLNYLTKVFLLTGGTTLNG